MSPNEPKAPFKAEPSLEPSLDDPSRAIDAPLPEQAIAETLQAMVTALAKEGITAVPPSAEPDRTEIYLRGPTAFTA